MDKPLTRSLFNNIVIGIFLSVILFSCIPQKRIKYVQDPTPEDTINELLTAKKEMYKIQPYDELLIRVMSADNEESYKFFNYEMYSRNTQQNQNLLTHTVSDSGYIIMPYLGKIFVSNMTLEQAKYSIEDKLSDFLETPNVVVKFSSKYITMLGEVSSPGRYSIGREQINILQALGLAGDLTNYANRNRITLIREIKDSITTFNYIDITSKDIVRSEYYYMKPNDIVYVEPLRQKFWGVKTSPPETLMTYITYITTLASLVLFIQSL